MSESNLKTKTRLAMGDLLDRILGGIAPAHPATPARALDLSELEERILLSASPMMVVAEMAEPAPAEVMAEESVVMAAEAAPSSEAEGSASQQSSSNVSTNPSQNLTHEIVFLDTSVEDYQQLLDDLWSNNDPGREFEVVLLSSSRDGIEQITEALAARSDLDAVHIVSHGTDSAVKIGSTWLTQDNLAGYVGDILKWQNALSVDADLLFYGCNLADSDAGQSLLESVQMLTGADVAASDDDTGHAIFGADWELEYQVGQIETQVAFSQDVQDNWGHLLNVAVDNTSTGTSTGGGITISHTTAGADRLLLVGVSIDEASDESVDKVTYNGHFLTHVGSVENVENVTEIWALVNPDLGTHNVVITFTGTTDGNTAGVMSFTGVDQSTPLGTFASNSGNGGSGSVTVGSATGDLVFGVISIDNVVDYDIMPDGAQSEDWDLIGGADINGGGSTKAGAASVNLSWSWSGTDDWSAAGVSIKPVVTNTAPTAANSSYSIDEDGTLVVGPTTTNLVEWWELNDGSGQTAVDSVAPANNGTLGSTAGADASDPTWVAGHVGSNALSFDGTDDYVETTSTILQTATDFTLSTWFQADSTIGPQHILWQGYSGGNGYGVGGAPADSELNLSINSFTQDNKIVFFLGYDIPDNGADPIYLVSESHFTDTTDWHHVAVTVTDLGGGTFSGSLYVDGVLEATDTGTENDRTAWGSPLLIGKPDAAQRYFDGQIDEVRIYDAELTATEVRNLALAGVMENDTDPESDILDAILVSGPTDGTLDLETDGSFTYSPDGDFAGVDSFTYKTNDGSLDSNTATVTITVNPINDFAPVITSNGGGASASTNVAENTTAVTTVTATDADLPGDTLTYSISGGADSGKFSINGTTGDLTFAVAPDFETPTDVGTDNVYDVIVEVSDGTFTDTQSIAVTVTAVNDNTPTITSDGGGASAALNVAENATAVTTVTATDADLPGDTLTYSISGGADSGKFSINGTTGDLTFAVAPDFETPTDVGTDNVYDVIVEVSDGTFTDSQSIAVTVTAENDAPVATADPGDYAADLLALNPISYWRLGESSGTTAGDDGTLANAGTYNGTTLAQSGAINGDSNTAVRFNGTSDYVAFAHVASYLLDNGTIQLWFNADAASTGTEQHLFSKDSTGFDTGGHISLYLTTSGLVEVRMQSTTTDYFVQTASSVSSGAWHHVSVSFGDNGLQLFVDGELADIEAYTGGLGTTSGGSGNANPIAIGAGTQNSGDNVITPVNEFFGGLIDEVAILGSQLSAETIQDLYAAGLQHYEVASGGTLSVPTAEGVLANDFDAEGGSLTAIQVSGPSNAASFTLQADGSFDYTPNTTFSGTDSFTYKVNDGTVDGNTTTVTLTVTNQAPTVSLPGSALAYLENDAPTVVDATATVTDSGSADFDTGTLTIDFTANGTANDRLAIRNEGTGSGQIGVSGANVSYEGTTIGTFAGGTSGSDPLVITFNASSTPTSAQALMRNITFENVSDDPSTAARTVRFVLTDGDGGTSNAATQTVNITAENDTPVITSNGGGPTAAINVAENTIAVTTVTSTDPDGGTPVYSISGGADAAKFAINSSSGVLTFVLAPDVETPTDVGTDNVYNVTVQVSDGALTDTQSIAVTVTAVNDNTPTITSDGGGASAALNVAENATAVTT
ncbi:MAG: hypothetical protein ACI8P0_002411, partial [Planctomycetaceae bacterium]